MAIRVECPSCGKGIKAPSKYAGKSAKCPGCGGKISIPQTVPPSLPPNQEARPSTVPCPFCSELIQASARKCRHCGEFLDGSDRTNAPVASPPVGPVAVVQHATAAKSGYSKEHDLLTVRPKVFRNAPVSMLFLISVLLVGSIVAANGEILMLWVFPALAVFILLRDFLSSFTTLLTIINKRSILRRGILSKRTREVRHSDVRLLQVDQSFFQRIMGVGSVSIASAGHGEVEIMVGGLKNPVHVKETVDGYRS